MKIHAALLTAASFAALAFSANQGIAQDAAQLLAAPGVEAAAEKPVTAERAPLERLEDVMVRAYETNPTLHAARAELKATDEGLAQAQAGWRPSADVTGTVTRAHLGGTDNSADGTTSKEVEAQANQPLYRGGRTTSSIAAARELIKAQRAILSGAEQTLLYDVATAYMDVVRDMTLLDLRTNNRDVIARQLEATNDRFSVGEITRTDVSQAEARYARAEADRINAEGALETSKARYEQVIGMMPGQLGYPVLNLPLPHTLGEATAYAEQNSPDIVYAEYFHSAAKRDVGTVFGELLPDVGLFAGVSHTIDPQPGTQDDSTTSTFGLSASVPLYEAGATRSRVREAKYTANQRLIEIEEARRQIRQQVVSNWATLGAARSEIKARQSQVEANRIAQEGVKQETALGARTILDSLDADQEYLDARAALVTAQRNEIVATFALARSLGLLTPETLGFGQKAYNPDRHLRHVDGKAFGMDVDIGDEVR